MLYNLNPKFLKVQVCFNRSLPGKKQKEHNKQKLQTNNKPSCISAQNVVMIIYRNNSKFHEQIEDAGLPFTLRIEYILCENTEQESKNVTEQNLKMIKIGFEHYCMLNTIKMIEILIHWRRRI